MKRTLAVGLILTCWLVGACAPAAKQPKYYEVVELSGSPYERGRQHGEHLASKIKSLYTTLLTTSIFPYMNRERPDVADVLLRYQEERYLHGHFSYQMMVESGRNLYQTLPQDYRDELRGIADGSGMTLDEILILNTFVDTLLGFRSIVNFIKLIQAPQLLSVSFIDGPASDGVDNDGDGEIDEPDDSAIDPYEPLAYASLVEVPTTTRIRLVLDDDLEGVDPGSVRVQLDENLYVYGDPALSVRPYAREGKTVEVILTPPGGLQPASFHSIIVQAGDWNRITDTPPVHARFMRDERIAFTTAGYGQPPWNVPNRGFADGRTQPPSIGFAATGEATTDGRTLLAHHFAMLDANTSHKHTVLFVQRPNNGKPYAYLGWAGVAWGFSGMNADGLSYLINSSDTLNSPFCASFEAGLVFAALLSSGTPIGFMGRELLAHAPDTPSGTEYLRTAPVTFGWNFLLADAAGRIQAVERDANIMNDRSGGFYGFTDDPDDPGNLDAWGRPLGSVGRGELHVASHYQKDLDEINLEIVTFNVRPQRFLSTFYFRSLRAFYNLGDEIAARYGRFDVKRAIETLRTPSLVDFRDSMNAAVFEPERRRIHFAMGQAPATDGKFRTYDLSWAADGGAP
jgi:hypothetical protein